MDEPTRARRRERWLCSWLAPALFSLGCTGPGAPLSIGPDADADPDPAADAGSDPGPDAAQGIGAERRCDELGPSCICSEPLNTPTYETVLGYDFNPSDTQTKECTKATSSVPGSVLEDGAGFRYVAETAGPMFDALPNRASSVGYMLRTKSKAEGNAAGGGQFLGHDLDVTPEAGTARIAFRGYKYYAADYELYRPGTCENSTKILQLGEDATLSTLVAGNGGNYHLYGWTGWNTGSLGCCDHGPGDAAVRGQYDEDVINGKWFRYEVVITNVLTTGPATRITVYLKNVTDDLPEVVMIDTAVPTEQDDAPGHPDWTSALATSLKPAATRISQIVFNSFRRDDCEGYVGFSHLLMAAWDTDEGQRIGAAMELEGHTGV